MVPTLSSNISFALHDVARLQRKRFEQRSRSLGLTRAQWQVLAILSANEGVNQNGLAELIDIAPITLARLIDKMEVRGLVERRRHPTDRRSWLLYLTPAAYPLLDVMRTTGRITSEEALASISRAEQERLLKTLSLIKSNLLEACTLPATELENTDG
jgi:DNA-binding MarR family transcriptional regulator